MSILFQTSCPFKISPASKLVVTHQGPVFKLKGRDEKRMKDKNRKKGRFSGTGVFEEVLSEEVGQTEGVSKQFPSESSDQSGDSTDCCSAHTYTQTCRLIQNQVHSITSFHEYSFSVWCTHHSCPLLKKKTVFNWESINKLNLRLYDENLNMKICFLTFLRIFTYFYCKPTSTLKFWTIAISQGLFSKIM